MFTEDSISLVSGFLLLCLFGLGAWALSRFIGKCGRVFHKGRYMKVVEQIQIAQDRQLFILRLEKENRCLLLGSGPEGVQLITELKEEYEEPASLTEGKSLEDFLPFLKKKQEGEFLDIFQRKKENRNEAEKKSPQVSERSPEDV